MMNDSDATLIDAAWKGRQGAGDVRRSPRDASAGLGANGARGVTNGWRILTRADNLRDLRDGGIAIVALALLTFGVNALTAQADNPGAQPWEPVMWEGSSSVTILLFVVIPWAASVITPWDLFLGAGWRPKLKYALVHLAGMLLFSAGHVAGFVLIRSTIYRLFTDMSYDFGDRFAYEFRKDALTYMAIVGVFRLTAFLRRRNDEAVRPVSFDIRDGARIIRTPVGEILAVSSAGNYVEFHLTDGRRPLMRATLAAVEAELAKVGFVRTHRSWLVNRCQVRGLRPEGSGDWAVELAGLEAPLSRRYPQALETLKA